jgi:hypothetical protein
VAHAIEVDGRVLLANAEEFLALLQDAWDGISDAVPYLQVGDDLLVIHTEEQDPLVLPNAFLSDLK